MTSRKTSKTQSQYDVHDLPTNSEEFKTFTSYWNSSDTSKFESVTEEEDKKGQESLRRALAAIKFAAVVHQQVVLMNREAQPYVSTASENYESAILNYIFKNVRRGQRSRNESVHYQAANAWKEYLETLGREQ